MQKMHFVFEIDQLAANTCRSAGNSKPEIFMHELSTLCVFTLLEFSSLSLLNFF